MTVQASSAGFDDSDAVFTAIFREFYPRVSAFVASRLFRDQLHLVDDLTQETFIVLWKDYGKTGRLSEVVQPFGLLAAIARYELGDFYERSSSTERALDFSDPVNTPIVATGHSYAACRPDTALMLADLEAATERMRELSKRWQKMHAASYRLRQVDAAAERIAKQDHAEDVALGEFREACRLVGELRAALHAVAGPAWRSSVAIPEGAPGAKKPAGYRSDHTITHCPEGHVLTLHNTGFELEERRVRRYCRACLPVKRKTPAGVTR